MRQHPRPIIFSSLPVILSPFPSCSSSSHLQHFYPDPLYPPHPHPSHIILIVWSSWPILSILLTARSSPTSPWASSPSSTPAPASSSQAPALFAQQPGKQEGCTICKIPKVSWNWDVTSIWCSWSWCGLVTLVSRCSNYTGFSLYKAVIPSQTWNCTKSPFRKWTQVSILFYIARNLEALSSSEVLSTWVFFTGLDQYHVDQLKHITKEVRN